MLVSSYANTAAGVLYAFLSVPLALAYLSKEQFGLWAVMGQVCGYLALVDFGMSSSFARLLIDHKDHPETGQYGSLIKTFWIVALVQGLVILVLGFAGSVFISTMLDLPDNLKQEFVRLLQWQCLIQAIGLCFQPVVHILYAHQRLDIINYFAVAQFGVSLGVLWLTLLNGAGIYSILWVNATAPILRSIIPGLVAWRLRLWPAAGQWGVSTWSQFKMLFGYSKDLFLISVGTQLMLASQTILLTRSSGLQVAAAWSVGSRMLQFCMLFLWRVLDTSLPAISEMIARNETVKMRDRFRDLTILSMSLVGLVAVMLPLCNTTFVHLWTHGKIQWHPWYDILLAIWLVVLAMGRPHNSLVIVTKQIRAMRYIYFVEGVVFVGLGLWTIQLAGIPALISTSIVCAAAMSMAYGIYRSTKFFDIPTATILWSWNKPMLAELLVLVPLTATVAYFWPQPNSWSGLLLQSGTVGVIGVAVFWKLGVPVNLQRELLQRLPIAITRWLPFPKN
jgi:O-antigen/teichoic acid export membrane protein